ncbi:MAG: bifunctional diaminohydroxyphosphoribosylaminopyrimidine deaminase/5-amino-6-(5-phosphoribosylamino)uracil reductase RibD [Candidatus Nanopelagicales bacterium]|nr:bifunctional diaminohydroxyphosphoribosylaminopyrimidine deaminase/5-amino-6-(5-phosphoribosylamino)uracil reductase RibD [Candidatus Nanopelagicales bacterium]
MTGQWSDAMAAAIALARLGPRSENPRVGCVILDASGAVVGRGHHRGAGSPHAEVAALADAGERAHGATAVVTLEPCRHTGRTGPCTEALIDAGITRVVFAEEDPTREAGGGAAVLRDAGVEVVGGVEAEAAAAVNTAWTHVQRTGRPWVVLKLAQTLDGRVADARGGPTAITGAASRAAVHQLRAESDAVLVGANTAVVDDPQLTVRDQHVEHQPLRVVMGLRALPVGLRVLDDSAPTLIVREHRPAVALALLRDAGVHQVLLEGGPTVAGAFLDARLVDELVWLLAPRLLGSGPVSVPGLMAPVPVSVTQVSRIGDDVLVRGRPLWSTELER